MLQSRYGVLSMNYRLGKTSLAGHTQSFDPMYLEFGVNNSSAVCTATHLACSAAVVASRGVVQHKFLPVLVSLERVVARLGGPRAGDKIFGPFSFDGDLDVCQWMDSNIPGIVLLTLFANLTASVRTRTSRGSVR